MIPSKRILNRQAFRGFCFQGSNLRHWADLCEEWCLLVERYSRVITNGDTLYEYNELSNVSALAGAAWRTGRIAMQEFQHEKRSGRQKVAGRCDLWMCTENYAKRGDRSREEFIEAKFKRLALCKGDKHIKAAEKSLDLAMTDARNTKGFDKDLCDLTVGLTFLPVYIEPTKRNESEQPEDLDSEVSNFLSKIRDNTSFHYDLMAWNFPPIDREFSYKKDELRYLGIIMLATKV